MGPDEELSDEAPELADEAGGAPDPVEESGVEFAAEGADVAMAGEAPDTDEYALDESAPKADLSNELAEDAGDSASYGFEAARETARFTRSPNDSDPDLAEASGVADDSDKYRIIPGTDDGPAPSFAEEVAGAVDQDAAYDPEPATAEDESAYASHYDGVDSDETTTTETDSGEAPAVADEAPAALEPEPEPEPEPARPARAAAPPRSVPAPAAAEPTPGGPDDRPGQVRRSAIDEMFARAAELKNKKKKS